MTPSRTSNARAGGSAPRVGCPQRGSGRAAEVSSTGARPGSTPQGPEGPRGSTRGSRVGRRIGAVTGIARSTSGDEPASPPSGEEGPRALELRGEVLVHHVVEVPLREGLLLGAHPHLHLLAERLLPLGLHLEEGV